MEGTLLEATGMEIVTGSCSLAAGDILFGGMTRKNLFASEFGRRCIFLESFEVGQEKEIFAVIIDNPTVVCRR